MTAYMRGKSGRRLDSYDPADSADFENPKTGLGTLAHTEDGNGVFSTVSTAAAPAPFCVVSFPPSDREVFIEWEVRLAVAVASGGTYGGNLDGVVWEETMSGSAVVSTEVDRHPIRVAKDDPVNVNHAKASGRFRVGPTTVRRTFALGASLTKDNAASALVGQIRNQPTAKSVITAVAT